FSLRICLTGEGVIAQMPQLTLPLLSVPPRPLGKGGPRAGQTGVRDDHHPALWPVSQLHLSAKPAGLPVCTALPLVRLLAQSLGGLAGGSRHATDPAHAPVGKPLHIRRAVHPAVGDIEAWLLARLLQMPHQRLTSASMVCASSRWSLAVPSRGRRKTGMAPSPLGANARLHCLRSWRCSREYPYVSARACASKSSSWGGA